MFANILWAANLPESEQLSWDIVRQIIQSQHNLATLGIIVIIAVAALVAGASWFTNFYISRRELRHAIESLKAEIVATRAENYRQLVGVMKDEIKKLEEVVGEKIDKKIASFDADKARLFALSAQNAQLWDAAAAWWAIAIEGYTKIKEHGLVRTSVNNVLKNLQKSETLRDNDREDIKKCLSFIPEILQKEREQIKEKLDKLPKEPPEGGR